jgi:hypothetical protein
VARRQRRRRRRRLGLWTNGRRRREAETLFYGESYLAPAGALECVAPAGGAVWAAAQEATVPFFFGFSTVFSLIFLLVRVFAIFAGFPIYWFVFS